MESIVLFGAGSPVIVDVEETCRRLGLRVAAVVRNVAAADQCGEPALVVALAAMPAGLLAHGVAVPLFTPANRRAALAEAIAHGAARFPPLLDPTAILPARLAVV